MGKSSLPALVSTTMVVQAALSTSFGARAKTSLSARNNVLVVGILVMLLANLSFALIPTSYGEPE